MTRKAIERGIYTHGAKEYEIQVSFGSGVKRKRKSRIVSGSIKEARKVRAEMMEALDNGLSIEAESITVEQYLQRWLKLKEPDIARSTWSYYRNYVKKWINPYLGELPLQELSKTTIKSWHLRAREDGVTDRSLQAAHKVLRQACRYAMVEEDGLLFSNPCDFVSTPKAEGGERGYLEIHEVRRMLDVLDSTAENAFTIAVRLGIATGARRGEILGLRWREVDLLNNRIEIKYSLSQVDNAREQGVPAKALNKPKTKHSRRWITLDEAAVKKLSVWKKNQAEQLRDLGLKQELDTPVCSSLYAAKFDGEYRFAGGFLDPGGFGSDFADFCTTHGFFSTTGKRLCFHELRHTQATLLISNNEDLVNVARRLGHHAPSLTMDMYSHAMPSKDIECAELMGNLTKRKKS